MIRYHVNLITTSTIDVVNRGCCGSAFLTVRVGADNNSPLPALLDSGAEMNLLPLSYCRQNKLSYAPLEDMNSTVYNGEALPLIGVTEDWICIGPDKIKAVFFVTDDETYESTHHILLGMPFILDTSLVFKRSKGYLFAHITLGDSRVMCGLGRRNQKPFRILPANGVQIPERYLPSVRSIRMPDGSSDHTRITIGSPKVPENLKAQLDDDEEIVGPVPDYVVDSKIIPALAKDFQADVRAVCSSFHTNKQEPECVCGTHRRQRVSCVRKWVDKAPSPSTVAKAIRRTIRPMIRTLYKRVGVKVHPVDDYPSDGTVPEGTVNWKPSHEAKVKATMDANRGSKYDPWIRPRFSQIEKGSRLTPDRLQTLMAKNCDGFSDEEKAMFTHLMLNREAALAWDWSHVSQISTDVAPPQVIRTIPHKAYQAPTRELPRALRDTAIKMLRDRQA